MTVSAVDINNAGAGYYSDLTGSSYGTYQEAADAENQLSNPVSAADSAPAAPAAPAMSRDEAVAQATANGEVAQLKPDGTYSFRPMTDAEKLDAASNPATAPAAPTDPNADPLATAQSVIDANKPYVAPAPVRTEAPIQGATAPFNSTTRVSGQSAAQSLFGGNIDTTGINGSTVQNSGVIPGSTPQSGAPVADTSKVDTTVSGVNNTISQLLNLANSPEYSAAEQQLLDSDRRNSLAAQQQLAQNQSSALGAARSGNRRDQALLQRQGIGESQYLGTQAQQQQVAQQTALEGNLATARAQEESQYTNDRAAMLSKAADLGLNVAALQTDISKANLSSASDYLNQQFNQLGIDKQISADQAKNVLAYMQGMAAIQQQYDSMSNDDQQHTLTLMEQQYGVDTQTAAAIEQARIAKQMNFGQMLTNVVGGVASGATGAVTKKLLG